MDDGITSPILFSSVLSSGSCWHGCYNTLEETLMSVIPIFSGRLGVVAGVMGEDFVTQACAVDVDIDFGGGDVLVA